MNNSSGINTILLVVVLIILVAGGVWAYMTYGKSAQQPAQQTGGLQVNLGQTNSNPQPQQ